MKKNITPIVLGFLLIGIGIGYVGNIAGLWSGFTVFFCGWWTLFLIVPGVLLLINGKAEGGLIITGLGLYFLAASQKGNAFLFKYTFPFILIMVGILIISNSKFFKFRRVINVTNDANLGSDFYIHIYNAVVKPKKVALKEGEQFNGASVTAVFAGVSLDLTNADITHSVVIEVNSWFAPIDITLPSNVKVLVSCSPILAPVHNLVGERIMPEGTQMIFVNGKAICGSVLIR